MSTRRFNGLWFSLLLACASPLVAHADSEGEHHDGQHGEHSEGGHGHHGGPITIRDVVAGDESLQFWGAVVNFALLVYVIRRMTKAPLANFLTGRRNTIERGISEAAEVKRAAEAAFNTYTERMKSLDAELAQLRKDVAEAAERDRARIVAEANDTVARLKSETEVMIQRQAEQLETQIRREVVAAAAEAAEKAVREVGTAEDQTRLAQAFMRELTKVAGDNESKGKRA